MPCSAVRPLLALILMLGALGAGAAGAQAAPRVTVRTAAHDARLTRSTAHLVTAPGVGTGENGWTGRRRSGRRWSGNDWSADAQ